MTQAPTELGQLDQGANVGLWRRLVEGDQTARRELVMAHLGQVRSIAWDVYEKANLGYLEIRDLMQLGVVGLLEAITRFELSRGVSFAAFAAKRIRGSMLNGLEKHSEYHAQSAFRRRIRRERVESLSGAHGSPSGGSDVFMQMVETAVGLAVGCLLEDTAMYVDESRNADLHHAGTRELSSISASLRSLVALLRDPDRQVIELHYLAGLPFSEVASMLELSKGRISQIHARALQALRSFQSSKTGFVAEM